MSTHQSPTPTAGQGSDVFIPSYKDMLWETVQALRALGGSGHVAEVAEKTIEIGGYSEAQQSALMPNGRTTKLAYKVYWCLSALKAVGRTDNSTRGVWSLTEAGQQLGEADIPALREEITSYYRQVNRRRRAQRDAAEPTAGVEDTAEDEQPGDAWKDELLAALREMEPLAFERLCKRLLRESGFKRVAVTKASGDGGIDGMGLLEIACSASRPTSSASATPAAWAPAPCATSAARWPAEERRGSSSPPPPSPAPRKQKPPAMVCPRSTSSTATACAICSSRSAWASA
jgi:Mrr restriction endonuclease-like protein/restriction endonuclease